MAFFRKRRFIKSNFNKFKQNKTIREPKSWVLPLTTNKKLLWWSREISDLQNKRSKFVFKKGNKRYRTEMKLLLRKQPIKVLLRYARVLQKQAKYARQHRITKPGKQLAYFFSKFGTARLKFSNAAVFSATVFNKFRISSRATARLLRRYKRRLNLHNWQGAMFLAGFQTNWFWNRYTLIHKHMAAIKKQRAYNNRHIGPKNLYRNVLLKTSNAMVAMKRHNKKFWHYPRLRSFKRTLSAKNKRQRAILWRSAVLKSKWGFRHLNLKFRFFKRTTQRAKLSRSLSFRQKWKRDAWLKYRVNHLQNLNYAQKLNVEQLKQAQQGLRYRVGGLASKLVAPNLEALKQELAQVSKKITRLTAPLPWWKQKQGPNWKKKRGAFPKPHLASRWKGGARQKFFLPALKKGQQKWFTYRLVQKWGKRRKVAYRGQYHMHTVKIPYINFNNKRHFTRFRWFKVPSRRFAAFNIGVAWGGALSGRLVQKYSRLDYVHKMNKRKTGLHVFNSKGGFSWKRVYKSNKLAAVKLQLAALSLLGSNMVNKTAKTGGGARGALLLSVRKASHALDFNKFFKVNKVVARNMQNISDDLYSQYISNLQRGFTLSKTINVQNENTSARAVRALRKYVKLLKQYFKEVHNNKMAKNIPASSAMHWIREYLRLTSDTRRRNALWNRFNRVAFNFKPKAKEDEKRGRKKKILFKAKILFDRLFQWLYAQPNARYALAAPIQNGVVRDYIVRNQFIFKKGFKIKLQPNKTAYY